MVLLQLQPRFRGVPLPSLLCCPSLVEANSCQSYLNGVVSKNTVRTASGLSNATPSVTPPQVDSSNHIDRPLQLEGQLFLQMYHFLYEQLNYHG
jgi:hypothetical protein